jgi:hypothetical protein
METIPPPEVQEKASVSDAETVPKPTTTDPLPLAAYPRLSNAPPARSPRPTLPPPLVQRKASY